MMATKRKQALHAHICSQAQLTCRCLRWLVSTRAQAEPSYRKATRMMPRCCSKLAHSSASRSPDSCQSLLSMVMGRGVLSGTTASRKYLQAVSTGVCLREQMAASTTAAQHLLWSCRKRDEC